MRTVLITTASPRGTTALGPPLKQCKAIRYHNHVDGCKESPDSCDASLLPKPTSEDLMCYSARYTDLGDAFGNDTDALLRHWERSGKSERRNVYCKPEHSFVVLRRPSDRFKSQFDHMHSNAPGTGAVQSWAQAYAPTQDKLLSFLESVFQGCTDDHCRVARIQANFSEFGPRDEINRVILYPASYFFRESTSFICYDSELLSERYTEFMHQHVPGCSAEPLERVNEDHSEYRDQTAATTDRRLSKVYPNDVSYWRKSCSSLLALADASRGMPAPEPSAGRKKHYVEKVASAFVGGDYFRS